jgi:hypothetical protein
LHGCDVEQFSEVIGRLTPFNPARVAVLACLAVVPRPEGSDLARRSEQLLPSRSCSRTRAKNTRCVGLVLSSSRSLMSISFKLGDSPRCMTKKPILVLRQSAYSESTRELAARIRQLAGAAKGKATEFTLSFDNLADIDRIAATVSALGNDPYFPSLEALGEPEVDRISLEIETLRRSAMASRARVPRA